MCAYVKIWWERAKAMSNRHLAGCVNEENFSKALFLWQAYCFFPLDFMMFWKDVGQLFSGFKSMPADNFDHSLTFMVFFPPPQHTHAIGPPSTLPALQGKEDGERQLTE